MDASVRHVEEAVYKHGEAGSAMETKFQAGDWVWDVEFPFRLTFTFSGLV